MSDWFFGWSGIVLGILILLCILGFSLYVYFTRSKRRGFLLEVLIYNNNKLYINDNDYLILDNKPNGESSVSLYVNNDFIEEADIPPSSDNTLIQKKYYFNKNWRNDIYRAVHEARKQMLESRKYASRD